VFPAGFVEEAAISPSYIFSSFVKDKLLIVVWLHEYSAMGLSWAYQDIYSA
jgi:hypothetical protein